MIEFTLSDVTSSDQQTKRGSRYLDWPAEGSVVVVVEVAPPGGHILPQLLLVHVVVQVEVQAHSQAGKVYCMIWSSQTIHFFLDTLELSKNSKIYTSFKSNEINPSLGKMIMNMMKSILDVSSKEHFSPSATFYKRILPHLSRNVFKKVKSLIFHFLRVNILSPLLRHCSPRTWISSQAAGFYGNDSLWKDSVASI